MTLSGCAHRQERLEVHKVYTVAQFEDYTLPPKPKCKNKITGDILECEQMIFNWACTISNQYNIFMLRATNDAQSVKIDQSCKSISETENDR